MANSWLAKSGSKFQALTDVAAGTSGLDKENNDGISLGMETNDGDIIIKNKVADKNNKGALVEADTINKVEVMVAAKTNVEDLMVLAPKVIAQDIHQS